MNEYYRRKVYAPYKGKKHKKHYVYELAYPEIMGGQVFYVGKGKGYRIKEGL